MATLYGRPGTHLVPEVGMVLTSSGIINCPPEHIAHYEAAGFTLADPDSEDFSVDPNGPPRADYGLVKPEGEAGADIAAAQADALIMTTGTYSLAKPANVRRKRA